ncbi:TetR/AcrR family transcriptional regulator [Thermobifida alba]|jgi:AcrR family transcriptional regulator|uniref:TetR/AcrR family transcriptional regulator n=1 Tax=Thermobifida alba TaxID=53522 RepID=A0ABY4L1G4_THEAE|nr:TetR/AcrR family transcriptional regulator [Thermobifida alba]UPT20060.1 TetR/AcrR family transcriptional regulator [Thermobifida alba]HLU96011.1 TetR/AcrR family transcriptional regulator [Thermobifida alba]
MANPTGLAGRRSAAERKPRKERWAELIETATQVFYERGYEAASLQEIANRIGMLKGSLYYYIQSKEDLLFEVVNEVHQKGLAVVTALAQGPSPSPLERLHRVIRGHVEHTCHNLVPTAVFLHELSALPEDRRRQVLGDKHSYQGVFRSLIEEAKAAGEVREDVDPKLAALSILGSANWVYRWYRPDGEFSAQQIASHLAETAIRGIASEAGLASCTR